MLENNMSKFDIRELEEDIISMSSEEKKLFDILEKDRKIRMTINKRIKELELTFKEVDEKSSVRKGSTEKLIKGKAVSLKTMIKILSFLKIQINVIKEMI